ncbi:MAG: DUF6599 family protein [Bacteroidales bacterium]
MKYRLLMAVLFSAVSIMVFSQDMNLPDLPGYKKVTSYPVYTPDNLWDFINGAADNYLSYGFEDLHVAEYKKGKNVIKLEVYRHKDGIQAFGIYSSERSPSFNFLKIGSQAYKADGSLNFFKGKYYVKIRTYSKSEKILQNLETLALRVADFLPGENQMPKTLSLFPEKGKKLNEESYINESVLGHEFLNGAFKAQYESGDVVFSVYLIEKNSNEEAMKIVSAYLKSAGLETDDPSAGKFAFKDGYNGDVFLSWKAGKIVIISGLARDQADIANLYSSEILN